MKVYQRQNGYQSGSNTPNSVGAEIDANSLKLGLLEGRRQNQFKLKIAGERKHE